MDGEQHCRKKLDAAEMGVIAHLYRGEVYRSTIWRTRLDTTTNWSVVTLGVALSITYSSPQASPLPLVLVGIRRFAVARATALVAVASVVTGRGVAQYPWLLVDQVTITEAAGAPATLEALLVAAGLAAVIVLPALG